MPPREDDIDLEDFKDAVPLDDVEEGDEDVSEDEDNDVNDESETGSGDGEEEAERPAKSASRKSGTGEDRIAALERELAEVRAARQGPSEADRIQQAAEKARRDEEERQRLAEMSPDERVLYNMEKRLQQSDQQNRQLAFQQTDHMDKLSYQAVASTKTDLGKLYNSYSTKVEQALSDLRRGGSNADRKSVFYYLLGKDMEAKLSSGVNKQKSAGQKRVNAAKARPVNGRGNAEQSLNRDSRSSLEKRLENQLI